MKALSLTQPFATLIAVGAKTIETRGWDTSYTGPIAIHASKGFPGWAKEACYEEPFEDAMKILPRGAIVAVAQLERCHRIPEDWSNQAIWSPTEEPWRTAFNERAFGNYEPGRYAWMLRDVIALTEPIPCKGSLGLWALPPDVEARLRELVPAVRL